MRLQDDREVRRENNLDWALVVVWVLFVLFICLH